MNIEIQFVDTGSIPSVESLVREKLDHVSKRYSWITNAAVFFKAERNDNENNSICEVRLSVPGPQLFASQQESSFEKAFAMVVKQLEIQLEKHKSKMSHH